MLAYPFDSTTGRPFLDYPASQPEDQLRNLLAEAIGLFIDAHVCHQPIALAALNQRLGANNPLIASSEAKVIYKPNNCQVYGKQSLTLPPGSDCSLSCSFCCGSSSSE